jgi:hypothetical protein
MVETTPNWRFVSIGLDGDAVDLDGIDPWRHEWLSLDEPRVVVAHPSHPHQRHTMSVYAVRVEGREVRFAAGEFSNGVWGFFAPTSPSR